METNPMMTLSDDMNTESNHTLTPAETGKELFGAVCGQFYDHADRLSVAGEMLTYAFSLFRQYDTEHGFSHRERASIDAAKARILNSLAHYVTDEEWAKAAAEAESPEWLAITPPVDRPF